MFRVVATIFFTLILTKKVIKVTGTTTIMFFKQSVVNRVPSFTKLYKIKHGHKYIINVSKIKIL
jgi:hypothetical protein